MLKLSNKFMSLFVEKEFKLKLIWLSKKLEHDEFVLFLVDGWDKCRHRFRMLFLYWEALGVNQTSDSDNGTKKTRAFFQTNS